MPSLLLHLARALLWHALACLLPPTPPREAPMPDHYVAGLVAGLWARWDASSADPNWRGPDIPVRLSNGLEFRRRHCLTRADVRDLVAYIEAEHGQTVPPDA